MRRSTSIDGAKVPALVQVTNMGMTWVLNRQTGEPVFPVEERRVPQEHAVPGEYLSETQPFPTKPPPLHKLGITPDDAWGITPWDEGACREALEQAVTGPIYTPISAAGTVMFPSPVGGNNWGSPAIHLVSGKMAVNTNHVPFVFKLIPQADCGEVFTLFPQRGSPYCVPAAPMMSPIGAPCVKPPWATLSMIDLNAGASEWTVSHGTLEGIMPGGSFIDGAATFGGPMITSTGLVLIAASSDPALRAYDLDTGEELWKAELPTTGNAVPMSYRLGDNGRQFVVIAAGGHWTSMSEAGDHLMAFALPE